MTIDAPMPGGRAPAAKNGLECARRSHAQTQAGAGVCRRGISDAHAHAVLRMVGNHPTHPPLRGVVCGVK